MQQEAIIKGRFDKVIDMIAAAGLASQIHPEESKLRYSQPIKQGKGQYIFNLKTTENIDGVVNHTLDRNDVFIPNRWGVMLGIKNTNTGVEKLYTFAPVNDGTNPSIFAAGFTNDNIEAIYGGYMQWLVDNTVYLSAYPMEKFHKVPETQGAFVLNSSDDAVQQGIQLQRSLDKDLELIYPRFVIAGTHDHKITVNFNANSMSFPVTEGYEAELVLMLDGFLVKSGCENTNGKNAFGDAVGQW